MPKTGKVELALVRNPEAEDIAALFKSLTGRKPTEAEMREVRKTLAEPSESSSGPNSRKPQATGRNETTLSAPAAMDAPLDQLGPLVAALAATVWPKN